ncbi:hypothetical protein DRI50_01845 [candidate division KSB1 bacterium]|nr:MAG: hypothetical protein DRI50_01845 [candidate division KSB1 bacterium]
MKDKLQKFAFILSALLALGMTQAAFSQDSNAMPMDDPGWAEFPFTPGDGLFISTFPDTASFLNGVFPIDDRGYSELPIVGKVNVSKMTIPELRDFLKQNYESYLKFPNIYVKPVVRVSLLGGFVRPGLYYVDINSSLWDVVHLAGGTLLEDGIKDLRWQHGKKELSKNIMLLYEKGISLRRMGFSSGDIFWTPSPTRPSFWDHVRDVLPILSFATTIWTFYNTYQRDMILLRTR